MPSKRFEHFAVGAGEGEMFQFGQGQPAGVLVGGYIPESCHEAGFERNAIAGDGVFDDCERSQLPWLPSEELDGGFGQAGVR